METNMTTADKKNDWQTKAPRILGPFFAIFGFIALIGSWAITDPTIEKINMVAGAMVFFGLFGLMGVTGLTQKIIHLQSQVDKLLKNNKQSDAGSN
jgi:hypothetical protein